MIKKCKITNCDKSYCAKGYCKKHWQQNYRTSERDTLSSKPEYLAWVSMKARCYNPGFIESANYMGRGITVCDEWRNDSKAFMAYMGEKPSPKHSLDRINNDGNYEPGNVKWSTSLQQGANKTTRSKYSYPGLYCFKEKNKGVRWTAKIHKNYKMIHLGTFNTEAEAVIARKQAELLYDN